MKLLIATRNAGKFQGIRDGLKGLPFEFVSPDDEKIEGNPEETGKTYEENARLKAEYFGQRSGLMTLADDSGFTVEALAGELGVKTRRWGAGPMVSDQEWLDFFLKRMATEKNRRAASICVLALRRPTGEVTLFRGETPGLILEHPQAPIQKGIPLSAVFAPDGHTHVFSAMVPEEWAQVSHRGKAVRALREFLAKAAIGATE